MNIFDRLRGLWDDFKNGGKISQEELDEMKDSYKLVVKFSYNNRTIEDDIYSNWALSNVQQMGQQYAAIGFFWKPSKHYIFPDEIKDIKIVEDENG